MTLGVEHNSPPRHAWEVPFVGVPTRFESNTARVIEVAREALGPWQNVVVTPPWRGEPVVVRIEVFDDDAPSGKADRIALRYDVADLRLTITGPDVHAVSDVRTRRAVARVPGTIVDDAEHFRYGMIESLALFVISHLDRQPLHAAAVGREDGVVLLVGPAGVGKSTLTYAALRAGFQVFAEDLAWLQIQPALRIWGLTTRIHLPADAGRHFSELAGRAPVLVAAGEPKLVVPVEPHQRPAVPHTRTVGVCLLERPGGAAATLRPASPEVVRRRLAPTEPGFLLFEDTIGPALDRVAAPGGWHLGLTDRPDDAIPLLEDVVRALGDLG